MGYSTDFTGELKIKRELKASEISALNKFLGHDRRDLGYAGDSIYENGKYGKYWYHFDLEFTPDFSGLRWNGAEKSYGLEHIINFLIDKSGVDLQLDGELLAQGESYDDRWRLVMVNGRAVKKEFPRIGSKITCPHCCEEFVLEEDS